jgi:hypothetical protein
VAERSGSASPDTMSSPSQSAVRGASRCTCASTGEVGSGAAMTDATTRPPSDDAYIIAVSRALAARNEQIKFAETEVTEAGAFKIAVSILPLEGEPPSSIAARTASTTVLLRRDIAHGRRTALEKAMAVEREDDVAGRSP